MEIYSVGNWLYGNLEGVSKLFFFQNNVIVTLSWNPPLPHNVIPLISSKIIVHRRSLLLVTTLVSAIIPLDELLTLSCWMIVNCTYSTSSWSTVPNSIVCIYRQFVGRQNVMRLTPLPPKRHNDVILSLETPPYVDLMGSREGYVLLKCSVRGWFRSSQRLNGMPGKWVKGITYETWKVATYPLHHQSSPVTLFSIAEMLRITSEMAALFHNCSLGFLSLKAQVHSHESQCRDQTESRVREVPRYLLRWRCGILHDPYAFDVPKSYASITINAPHFCGASAESSGISLV